MALIIGSVGTISVNATSESMGDIEQDVNTYITNKYPYISIGSSEYVDFLTDQLMFDADKGLAKKSNYKDIRLFASKFLHEIENPQYITQKETLSGEKVATTTDLFKEESVAVAKTKAERNATLDLKEQNTSVEAEVTAKSSSYNVTAAVNYAHKYAEKRNTPAYESFLADCTNFVSQCIHAGGKGFKTVSNYKSKGRIYKTTSYWYCQHYTEISPYHRYCMSSSFVGVGDFYTYWKNHGAKIIQCSKASLQREAKKGDIVQIKDTDGEWYHSIIITAGKKGAWKYCGYSNNRNDNPVSEIKNKNFRIIRF